MTRISLRAFAVIASAILIGSVSVVPVWAASYRVFEYFHFEGLPDDHCQMEPTWGPEKTAWQGCNYHASNPIGEAKITRSARNIDVDGVTYACVGWEFATGSITPASGKVNFVSFNLDADSSITWIYKKAHKVSFSVSQMSNRLSAWGDDPAGPNTSTPTDILPLRWDSIAAGSNHTLAISQDGSLWAWGNNQDGQLGLGDNTKRARPTRVAADLNGDGDPDRDWVSVAATGDYSLAIKSNGTLWAWGRNQYYQLGLGAGGDGDRNTPTQVDADLDIDGLPDSDWVSVAAAGYYSMARKSSYGATYAWGYNGVGSSRDFPSIKSYHCVSIAAGGTWTNSHALVVLDGTRDRGRVDGMIAWGKNEYGQLGLGHTTNIYGGEWVGPDTDWVSVAAGYRHALALNLDGTLWAWGDNGIGQLGLGGGIVVKYTPTQVGTESDWTSVEAGYHHSLAIKSDGTLWAWGWNTISQLGLGADQPNKYTPVKVGSDTDWTSVAAGYDHSLAIKSNGTLWAWGDNGHGQLGLGHDSDKSTPTQVVAGPLATWVSVAVGAVHTLALRADGTLWAWGKHEDGQLGQCTPEIIYETEEVCTWVDGHEICETILIPKEVCGEVRTPSQVGTDTDWVSVAAGEKHTVAIRGPARFDFKPYIGNGLLAEGTQVEASAKVIPTDGSRPYYLTNFTANPTTGGSSFTVESDLNFTWTYEPALELTVAFDQNVPDGVRANAGSNPPEGKNQFVEGSEVTLQILPVVKDPDTGTTYVCTGWTGTDRVPSSGTGSSVTVESLTVNSSITWKYAEARSLTTEFDGLPDHLQTDVFDPRGADKGWDPEEPVWLAKESNQTINPPTEIYDEGGRVRYVLDLGGSFGDKDLPDPFVVTRDYTVTWKYRK